jgi:quaternary ammonium compound-resistance protein SugE
MGAVGTAIYGMTVLGEPRETARIVCLFMIVAGTVGLKLFTKTA